MQRYTTCWDHYLKSTVDWSLFECWKLEQMDEGHGLRQSEKKIEIESEWDDRGL